MTAPVPPAPEEGVPATEPSATDDPVVANIRAMLDMELRPPTWGEVRYLLAHVDMMRGYAKTGEEVEGVLIEANLDDCETTPAETVRALLARANTAKVLLKEARRYVEDNIAGRFVPSNGDAAALLSRIDAALKRDGEG